MQGVELLQNANYVLCYVDGPWAYFTTQPLEDQWGDDWDDAPYEHNAGEPYPPCWHNSPYGREYRKRKNGDESLCKCKSCKKGWNPDGTPKFDIAILAYSGGLETPDTHHTNSPYSVEAINKGAVAWLNTPSYAEHKVAIPAGTTIPDFVKLVNEAGGKVYAPIVGTT